MVRAAFELSPAAAAGITPRFAAGGPNDANKADADRNTFHHRLGTAGDATTASFTEPGTYAFYCTYHADDGMTGIIQVV